MIVVDADIISYLLMPGSRTKAARRVFRVDGEWIAPPLWKSEVRNVLATHVRVGELNLEDAQELMRLGEHLMMQGEVRIDSNRVLSLANQSGCSAYDSEYVALAEELNVQFVTQDRKLLKSFPEKTHALADFGPG